MSRWFYLPRQSKHAQWVGLVLLMGCSDAGTPGLPDSGTVGRGDARVAGIAIPQGLPRCSEAVVAQVTNVDVSFRWPKVADANRYAVHLGLLPGLDPEQTIREELVQAPSFVFSERNPRGRYRFVGYAVRDQRALCMLAGPTVVEPD